MTATGGEREKEREVESARVYMYHRGEWVGCVTSTDRALSIPQRLDQVY